MSLLRKLFSVALILGVFAAGLGITASRIRAGATAVTGADWPGFGGHDEAHYSPLTQINDKNVQSLGLAWFFDIDTGGASDTARWS